MASGIEEGCNRLHQVEKLTAMGSLLASVAHELNNPLVIVITQTTQLADEARDDDTHKRAERIRVAADRCGRIVKSFLAMARQKPPQREALDLEEVVRSSLDMVGYGLRSAGIDVETSFPPSLPAALEDRDPMSQVVGNLILNGQQAMMERPLPRRIEISGRCEDERVVLRLADNGPRGCRRKSPRESSIPISPPRRPASAPVSVCRSRARSSRRTAVRCRSPTGRAVAWSSR